MEWIIRFVLVWFLFTLLGGWKWKEFKVNIWCGVLSLIIQILIDSFRISHGYYTITNPIIPVFGSSLFFMLGPAIVVGMIISMFQPKKTWARIVHVVSFGIIFYIEEYFLVKTGALVYINWGWLGSITINFLTMATLSWFSIIILGKGRVSE